MTFSVTILGSSSALPTSTRFPSAHVLNVHERLFLIDCAEGTQMQLRRYRIKLSKINNIFISHVHGDHVLGLVGLISTLNLLGRKSSLNIYAHSSLEKILFDNLLFFVDNLSFKVDFHAIDTTKYSLIYDDGKVTVETIPLRHRIPSAGFLFREKRGLPNIRKELIEKYNLSMAEIVAIKNGSDLFLPEGKIVHNHELTYYTSQPRSYAYCSDTAYSNRIIKIVKGVDLLYHEATFAKSEQKLAKETGHSSASQAAKVALDAGVSQLIIGHFSSRYKNINTLVDEAKEVFPNTIGVEDGQTFDIPIKKGVEF